MTARLENICKSYGDIHVLRRVTLDIPAGITCLTGPSGCGKTTLLRILTGLETPDSGRVTGVPDRLAVQFQEDRLAETLTVGANLRMVLGKSYDSAAAQKLLSALDLENMLARTAGELSGGMKRRVSLARALLFDAPLLVLDEPFKGLDAPCARLCMDALAEKAQGRAVIMVSHDAREAEYLHARAVEMESLQGEK